MRGNVNKIPKYKKSKQYKSSHSGNINKLDLWLHHVKPIETQGGHFCHLGQIKTEEIKKKTYFEDKLFKP